MCGVRPFADGVGSVLTPATPAHDGGPAIEAALGALLNHLRAQGYEFTTVTPLSYARVLANRQHAPATGLRDVFGWSMPFSASCAASAMPGALFAALQEAGLVVREGEGFRSRVRVSSFDSDLFAHSAFPTLAQDAVFFGPDTYRFLNLIRDNLPANPGIAERPLRIADVGCGSGAGGIIAARLRGGAQVTLTDINLLALRYAAINAASAGVALELASGDALSQVDGDFDVVLSNPPYLEDDEARAYRHGGGDLGRALSVKIGAQALQRLLPGGRLILYTGVAIVNGIDHFIREMEPFLGQAGCTYTYAEIDPDVFGEELERPVYRQADRIAAVGLIAVKA